LCKETKKVIFVKQELNMNQDTLKKIRAYLVSQPIEKAWLFGSYSRGEEDKKSDIDLMVRFLNPNKITLFAYIHIINQLEEITGKKVDLVEEGQLRNFAVKSFKHDKILIYEKETAG